MEPDQARPDDESIQISDQIYRRIASVYDESLVTVDAISGRRRPSTGALKSDDDGLSVYLHQTLIDNELGPEALVRDPINAVISWQVAVPRSHGLGVSRDAWPQDIDEPEHPRNVAHALVKGLNDLGKNPRRRVLLDLAEKACWVIDPDTS